MLGVQTIAHMAPYTGSMLGILCDFIPFGVWVSVYLCKKDPSFFLPYCGLSIGRKVPFAHRFASSHKREV